MIRKPTYQEIIGMIDESNEKITGKLPNRDATFFKGSPEGSYFDGADSMEQLRGTRQIIIETNVKHPTSSKCKNCRKNISC